MHSQKSLLIKKKSVFLILSHLRLFFGHKKLEFKLNMQCNEPVLSTYNGETRMHTCSYKKGKNQLSQLQ